MKGTAAGVLLHLGEKGTLTGVLEKFEIVFGDVLSTEQILENFYSAKQAPKEGVALWACRLEDIIEKAKQKGAVKDTAVPEMLRSKFWCGLTDSHTKNALRHVYDTQENYYELLKRARAVEEETDAKPVKCNAQIENTVEKKLDIITQKLETMDARISKLESAYFSHQNSSRKSNGTSLQSSRACFYCQSPEHLIKDCPTKVRQQRAGNGMQPTSRGKMQVSSTQSPNPHRR